MAALTIPRVANVIVAMKPETVAGTDIFAGVYTAADIVNCDPETIRFTPDPNETEVRALGGKFGRSPSVLGATTGRVDFTLPIRGRGVAYSAVIKPEADLPLRGSMMAGTGVASAGTESWTYKPAVTEEVMTVYVVYSIPGGNALAVKMVGAIGTCRMRGVAGAGCFADFTFSGAYTRADLTYVSGTIPTLGYPTFKGAAFQIGSTNYAPCLSDMSLDLGVTTRAQPCMNAVSGVAGFYVADRRPRLTISPPGDREANTGWWTKLSTGNPLDDCTFVLGQTQYNKMGFNFGVAGASLLQTVAQSISGRDGIVIMPTELQPTIAAGEDDFSLVFN